MKRARKLTYTTLLPINFGSCNGCDVEIETLKLQPSFKFTSDYGKADVVVVTGPVTKQKARGCAVFNADAKQVPIVAVGTCAISGGIFHDRRTDDDPLEDCIHANIYVFGCPPQPSMIVEGIRAAIKNPERRKRIRRNSFEEKNTHQSNWSN